MTLLKSFLITVPVLLFTGCTDCFPPTYTSDKSIVFVKGTPYLVPHGALFNTTPIAEDVTVNDYHIYGKIPCKKGDLIWISPKIATALKETYRVNGADAFSYAYGEAIRTHHMGCARALSQSEYAYYQTKYGL